METQRQIEILENCVLILELKEGYVRGICDILRNLKEDNIISKVEYDEMKALLVMKKPSPLNEFYRFALNKYWNERGHNINLSFWWESIFREPLTRYIRIDYLKALIQSLK